MKKVLIFSDSHGDNYQMEKIVRIEKPDLVLHAGDYCCDFESISKIANYFCKGNNDWPISNGINGKSVVKFSFENINFLITHSHKQSIFYDPAKVKRKLLSEFKSDNINVFIYGHSHIEDVSQIDNVLFINPGSISSPRNQSRKCTYGVLLIDQGKILTKTKQEIIRFINEAY